MKRTLVHCVALFLLTCASSAWGAEIREQTFVIGADVNTQGQVTQTQVDADVSKGIASFLDLALKRWQFVPALRNGKAATVHTFIKVKLEVIPSDAGKYTLRASYLKHGPKWDNRPPQYPRSAIRERATGTIVLFATLNRDGRFEVSETRSAVVNNTGHTLEGAARNWLTRLHAVPENVDGQPVEANARVLVRFDLKQVGDLSTAHAAYSKNEQQLLLDAGFKPPFDNDYDPQAVDSVLETRVINPVTMHL